MRLYRQRCRAGLRCVTVQVRNGEVDAMVRFGWLDPDARNDAGAIADALHAWFDRALSL
jgi:hypothetical protein